MPDRPNIVLCICDQLRAFETGCYGNPVIQTPNVDSLARDGSRFELAVTNFPVCMAARSVLLSGEYNRTCTGGVGNVHFQTKPGDCAMPEYPYPGRPHLKDTTLPELLRGAGYETAAIGKWHIHSWPDDVGFDNYLIPRVHHCHSGQSFTENGGPEFVPDGWSVDFEAGRVEEFIGARKTAERPFFLYYSISPPHCPVADAPEEYLTMYDPDSIPLRPNVDLSRPLKDQDYWYKVYRWDFRHYNLGLPYADRLPEGYNLRQLIAEYYGVTTWMDRAVGRMLGALERAGLAENTIVVFTSDHGDNLGSLGLVQKGGPNEESIRVPLLMRGPGVPSGTVIADRVPSLVDIAPTLLNAAGVEQPDHMPGQSLLADRPPVRDYSVIEIGHGAAVRTPTHMLHLPPDHERKGLSTTPDHYFDLTADPYQLHNLAGTDAQSDTARDLAKLLHDWDASTPWMPEE
ncbi:MAG: sulfatase-like hydrolase/transferase [Armatimonadetes bacterium]|nr:sulfatase-like hydrolase/transferase [Armatimonadota bacterium]